MLKQINDILTNGNAATAAERLYKLFNDQTMVSREIMRHVQDAAVEKGVEPYSLMPKELVKVVTEKQGFDILTLLFVAAGSAIVGAAMMYFVMVI